MADGKAGYLGEIAAVKTGVGGLNSNLNPSNILLKNVILAEGVVMREDSWRKEPGTALFGTNTHAASAADLRIVALTDWFPTETIERIVHLRGDGKVYFTIQNPGSTGDPGAFTASDAGGFSGSGTTFGYFVTGSALSTVAGTPNSARDLFLFRKNHRLCVTRGDETDVHPITHPALDWIAGGADAHPPICGVINGAGGTVTATFGGSGGRLVAAGNDNNPHMLYFSNATNQEVFDDTDPTIATNSQAVNVFPGIGERIYALSNYKGFIVVFKYPRGIFLFDARDPDPTTGNWIAQLITEQLGIAQSAYAALKLENDVIFLGADGQFYLLSAVIGDAQGQNNLEAANLGMDLEIYQFLKNAYNHSALSSVQSVYQPFWQTAQFTITGPSLAQNNTILRWEFGAAARQNGEVRFSYSYRDSACSLALRRDPVDFIDKPMYGDYGAIPPGSTTPGSNIILMERDTRTTWNGASYPMRVQTPHTNLGEFEQLVYDKFVQFANRNKNFDNLEIEFLPLTAATVTVSIFIDGILKQTLVIPLEFGGAVLDHFVLDKDRLGTISVRSVVHRLNPGPGRRISIEFTNGIPPGSNIGEDIAITHFFLGFRVSDTTQTPRVGNIALVPTTNFTLTITSSGAGSGTTSPSIGAHVFLSGTIVSVTATPTAGSQFVIWSGDVPVGHTGDNPVDILMDANKTINVEFELQPVLSIVETGSGTGVVTSDV